MPLTKSGKEMMASMKKEYGGKKGESVFYATLNKHPGMKHKMEGKTNYSSAAVKMARSMV